MTEYELADLFIGTLDSAASLFTVFLTVISAYLAVAWVTGIRLTRAQVLLVNAVFTFFGVILIFGWISRFEFALSLQNELMSLNPRRIGRVEQWITVAVSSVMFLFVFASLKFMWDVRHPKA